MTANARSTHRSFIRGRTRSLALIRTAMLVVLCALAACSDDPTSDSDAPDDVSALVGKKGGMLKSKGVTVVIPQDALDKDVTISIKNKGYAAPSGLKVKQASDVFEFGPAGTKFKKDVEVQFHTDKDDEHAVVYFTKENSEEFVKIDSEKKAGESGKGPDLVAKTNHFSQGFVGIPESEELDGGMVGPDGSVIIEDGSVPEDASVGPDAALVPKHIVVLSKDAYGLAVNQTWAAFQDGDGAWNALMPSSSTGTYEFDILSSRYAVAFVCADPKNTNSHGTVHYKPATETDLSVVTLGASCTTSVPEYVRSGTVTGNTGETLRYANSHESGQYPWTTGGSYSVGGFRGGEANDLVFGLATTPDSGLYVVQITRNLILNADVPTAGSTELIKSGVRLSSFRQAQVSNASDLTTVDVSYTTRSTETGLWLNNGLTTGVTSRSVQFAILPEAARLATDRYFLLGAEESTNGWRKATLSTYASDNLTIALPASFDATFSSKDTPYLRPSYGFATVSDAEHYAFAMSYKVLRAFSHEFVVELDPAWLEEATSHELLFPDFSQVTGFNTAWVPPSSLPQSQVVDLEAAVHMSKMIPVGVISTVSGKRGAIGMPAL